MSNTESFIITVPKRLSKVLDNGTNLGYILEYYKFDLAMALINRIPINNIKAEIEKLDEGITSYHNDKPWVYKSEVLEILNRIGKGE